MKRTSIIDPNLNAYTNFFDHKWAEQVSEMFEATPASDLVFNLLFAVRLSANTYVMPWLMVQQFKGFADEMMDSNDTLRQLHGPQVVDGLTRRLVKYMGDSLNSDRRRKLGRQVERIENEVYETSRRTKTVLNPFKHWDGLIEKDEFRFCVLGTQRLSYVALYFAYEDFIAGAYRLKTGDATARIERARDFGDRFARAFSNSIREKCWSDRIIVVASLVRNCLAHNGGRVSRDLANYKRDFFLEVPPDGPPLLQDDKFTICGNEIQITAGNTRFLFNEMKDRVTLLLSEL